MDTYNNDMNNAYNEDLFYAYFCNRAGMCHEQMSRILEQAVSVLSPMTKDEIRRLDQQAAGMGMKNY